MNSYGFEHHYFIKNNTHESEHSYYQYDSRMPWNVKAPNMIIKRKVIKIEHLRFKNSRNSCAASGKEDSHGHFLGHLSHDQFAGWNDPTVFDKFC